jgi:hypothetical protein
MNIAVTSRNIGFAGLVFLSLASGCATTRSTIDIAVPQAQAAPTKQVVKIVAVSDLRTFESAPSDPSVPSLKNPEEIKDPSIRSRAIARKRGGFGNAAGDILLPEGRTVEQFVREAATSALAQKGYSVVDEKSPQFEKALPLSIEVQQFWAWFTPGFFTISVEFECKLRMKGQALFGDEDAPVRGYAILHRMAATEGVWQEAMQEGTTDLVEKIKARMKSPE